MSSKIPEISAESNDSASSSFSKIPIKSNTKPEVFDSSQPWADGPYCPKCDIELEEKNEGLIFKKNLWTCPTCKENYDKPKCDLKDQVEKNFTKQLKWQGRPP